MKFGKKLRFRAVYPWLAHYIDVRCSAYGLVVKCFPVWASCVTHGAAHFCWLHQYKGLKKVVKQAKLSGKPIAKEFDAMFDAQLKKVCAFYNAVFLRLQTEIKAVTGMCAHNTTSLPRTWLLVWHHIAADARPRGCGRLAASERSVDYIASSLCTMDGMTALETLLHHLSCELSKLVDFAEVNVEGFRKIAKKFHKHVPESGMRFMPRVRAQPMAHQHDVQSIANLLESGLGELSRVKRTVEVCGAVAVPCVCVGMCRQRLHVWACRLPLNSPTTRHRRCTQSSIACIAFFAQATRNTSSACSARAPVM